MLVLQLASSGLLGPRMFCTDADGTQSLEWARFSCCTLASGTSERHLDECGGAGCGESPEMVRGGPAIGNADCGCVDEPAADAPVVRRDDSRQVANLFASNLLVPALATVALWPEPLVNGRLGASLPRSHAPPRDHITTVVLRI